MHYGTFDVPVGCADTRVGQFCQWLSEERRRLDQIIPMALTFLHLDDLADVRRLDSKRKNRRSD